MLNRRYALAQLDLVAELVQDVLNRRYNCQGVVGIGITHMVHTEDIAFHRPLTTSHMDIMLVFELTTKILVADTGWVADGRDRIGRRMAE